MREAEGSAREWLQVGRMPRTDGFYSVMPISATSLLLKGSQAAENTVERYATDSKVEWKKLVKTVANSATDGE